ncbi:MAG: hypothetical protein A3F67_01005 [Verrucomicrobia bacterium RIFCSPHIGHO2_12_FULL_41_10]|nr:MAG: hypothetical protein A3F67_01005 [Verrucomicrobia bacterium RIFCSPHIGHO2_12_FULL_41_10]HLB33108.1 glycosyltransferase family 9 protein [Chthoniobacterales bacterium]
MKPSSPRRILLVKPSSMGDVIHALPVVAALHQHWPHAEIRWLIHPAWSELVEGNAAVSQVILFPRENFRGIFGWGRSLLWARTLREWRPDLAIDLQGLLRSALMARLSGASKVLGLSDAREGASLFYSATVSVNSNDHAVKRYLSVLDLLGVPHQTPEFYLPEGKLPHGFSIRLLSKIACADEVQGVDGAQKLSVQELLDASGADISSPSLRDAVETDEARRTKDFDAGLYVSYCLSPNSSPTQHSSGLPQVVVDGDETIRPNTGATKQFAAEVDFGKQSIQEPFIVIHPYARGEGKNLTKEQVAAFAEELGTMPLVLVGKGESMKNLPSNVSDWSGKTSLLELIGLLRRAAFIVSSDSGPMHLAVAIQPSRTLAIHRWSDPLRVGPWAKESLVWKQGEVLRSDQLTEAFRMPGRTPTLEEMREIGRKICRKLTGMAEKEC